jgi:hypothetical protein
MIEVSVDCLGSKYHFGITFGAYGASENPMRNNSPTPNLFKLRLIRICRPFSCLTTLIPLPGLVFRIVGSVEDDYVESV